MTVDRFGRPLTNFRISVTQTCNLNCIYCHREGTNEKAACQMTPEEIEKIVEVATLLGMRKVKITGGEPLLRDDICDIISKIKGLSGVEEVSMTTNGVLLANYADKLKEAGLNRVNVGLASLTPETYQKITGVHCVEDVKKALDEAEGVGLTPVKINMVILRSINDGQVWDAVDYVTNRNIVLQLIELEKIGLAESFYERHYVDLHSIEEQLKKRAQRIEVRGLHNRMVYHLSGSKARVEFVRPFHESGFCMNCTRLRLTADGMLKSCLMRSDNHLDIISYVRNYASKDELRRVFMKAVTLREPYFREGCPV